MVTRRETIFGLAAAATGGAVLSTGASTSSVSAGGDMRVVVVSDLRLLAAREGGEYVDAEEARDPFEEFIIPDLNENADTHFDRLATIVNEGDISHDQLRFKFEADDEEDADVVDALAVVSESDIEEGDGVFTIAPEEGLEPGDEIEFGISVDLLPGRQQGDSRDLSEGADVELEITTEPEDDGS